MINLPLHQLMTYCEAHTTPQTQILYELERETHLKTLAPQMLSGAVQGQFLRLLCLLQQPKTALEIGTFTGYAALCIAGALPPDGLLHTIEANAEMEGIIRKYITKAKLEDKIQLHIGQAESVIPNLNTSFDFVFMDAGKQYYLTHYQMVIDRLNPGGLLIADNVLWSGKVLLPEPDADTQTIQAFNEMIQQDERVENIMLPLRDGVMIARKNRIM